MKKIFFLFFLSNFCFGQIPKEQEIIALALRALGGEEKLSQIKRVYVESTNLNEPALGDHLNLAPNKLGSDSLLYQQYISMPSKSILNSYEKGTLKSKIISNGFKTKILLFHKNGNVKLSENIKRDIEYNLENELLHTLLLNTLKKSYPLNMKEDKENSVSYIIEIQASNQNIK